MRASIVMAALLLGMSFDNAKAELTEKSKEIIINGILQSFAVHKARSDICGQSTEDAYEITLRLVGKYGVSEQAAIRYIEKLVDFEKYALPKDCNREGWVQFQRGFFVSLGGFDYARSVKKK